MSPRSALIALTALASIPAIAQQVPPVWDSATTYPGGSLVEASNGCVYRAIHSALNHNPITDGHSYWELYTARTSLVLRVASKGAVFKSVQAAWAFILNATITGQNTIQINIAPPSGTYTENFAAPFNLDHPFGSQISIIGSNRSAVVFNFAAGVSGLTLDNSHAFGAISGLTVVGPLASMGVFDYGVTADSSAKLNSASIKISGFGSGVYANHDARVDCTGSAIQNQRDFGIVSENHADVRAENCTINTAVANNLGGIFASYGGSVIADSASVAGYTNGIQATIISRVIARGSTLTNCNYPFLVDGDSFIDATNAACTTANTVFTATGQSHIDAVGSNPTGFTKLSNIPIDTVSTDGSCIRFHA